MLRKAVLAAVDAPLLLRELAGQTRKGRVLGNGIVRGQEALAGFAGVSPGIFGGPLAPSDSDLLPGQRREGGRYRYGQQAINLPFRFACRPAVLDLTGYQDWSHSVWPIEEQGRLFRMDISDAARRKFPHTRFPRNRLEVRAGYS